VNLPGRRDGAVGCGGVCHRETGRRPETQPVARILVVISDGEDNSSKISLKQAIAKAQQGEVAVYTVSTRDRSHEETAEVTGDRALKTLSELTGGSAFRPVSVHGLN